MTEEMAELYRRVFVHNPDGQRVLEHLAARFYDIEIFVKGAPDETAFRAGRRHVVGHIINTIAEVITDDGNNSSN